jgi:hypothetical protein
LHPATAMPTIHPSRLASCKSGKRLGGFRTLIARRAFHAHHAG